MKLGFVDGILFAKDSNKNLDEDEEKDTPEEDENPEKSAPDEKEQDEDKKPFPPKKNMAEMLYSPSMTTSSLMQKISAMTPQGVPINQLEKRLNLLKN